MRRREAFTIVELLVSVAIIAVLIGILLPALTKAREQAKLIRSQCNLRNLGAAHVTYATEWGDRQVTYTKDTLASYGDCADDALANYLAHTGEGHPDIIAGWGPGVSGQGWYLYRYKLDLTWPPHHWAVNPLIMHESYMQPYYGFGVFRDAHAYQAFNQYVGGRYYDPVFYAPKDTVAMSYVQPGLDSPYEILPDLLDHPDGAMVWSSYCMSPAAMYSPDVFRSPGEGGFQDPWALPGGLRSPSMSQALYPNLKTHMIEHHWLQNRRVDCNPNFADSWYDDGCEPYYFNHAWQSVPLALFFDGHVASLGVREAELADARMIEQAGWGLWSRDTPLGADGYFISYGYDFADTSFHILTTDGIRGRDTLGE